MIARMDDVAHVKKSTLKACPNYPGWLIWKISWSKNVHDERDCPDQMLLGDMEPSTCVYLNLALFLEKWLKFGDGNLSQWLFCEGSTCASLATKQDIEANCGKARHAKALKKIIKNKAFTKACKGKLDSHSICKSSATKAREKGVPKDDLEHCT